MGKVIASGAFGRVTKAKHFGSTDVAVKQLHAGGDVMSLIEEVEAMRKLRHPNLLGMIGLASDYSMHLGLVMEFVPATLFSLLHSKLHREQYASVLTWAESYLAIITDVARGVQHLHYMSFVHRDLKPQNVLVSSGWVGKVSDFGEVQREAGMRSKKNQSLYGVQLQDQEPDSFAKKKHPSAGAGSNSMHNSVGTGVVTIGQTGLLASGMTFNATTGMLTANGGAMVVRGNDDRMRGTAPYLSPEAASAGTDAKKEIGPPADAWGFGCLMAHVAARSPPYLGTYQKASEVVHALRDGTAQPLHKLSEHNIPTVLRGLAERCCAWEAAQRPTFAELVSLLGAREVVQEVCGARVMASDEDDEEEGRSVEARRPGVRLRWLMVDDKPDEAAAPAAEQIIDDMGGEADKDERCVIM